LLRLLAIIAIEREEPWYERALPWVMATLLAAIVVGWLIAQVQHGIDLWLAGRPDARGFEVKPNTGGTPVLRQKEKNHG
jgi:hypothetical protein